MNLNDLDTFIRVAESGSFTHAAQDLGVPKSTVSRRVSRLEEQLGVQLLQRTARSFGLTDDGLLLRSRCGPALREIIDVERALADASDKPRGTLRVTAPRDLGSTRAFAAILSGLREQWPAVAVEVDLSTRMVDLVEEGFDVAVRVHNGPLPDSASLMVRPVGAVHGGLFASPSYLSEHGSPQAVANLSEHECVAARGPAPVVRWVLQQDGDAHRQTIAVDAAFAANDYGLVLSALVAGAGIGLVPTFLAADHVQRGELVPVLPQWRTAQGSVSLVWPASRHLAPRVRAFIDLMSERMGAAFEG